MKKLAAILAVALVGCGLDEQGFKDKVIELSDQCVPRLAEIENIPENFSVGRFCICIYEGKGVQECAKSAVSPTTTQ